MGLPFEFAGKMKWKLPVSRSKYSAFTFSIAESTWNYRGIFTRCQTNQK